MPDDSLGSLGYNITGDYSDLAEALEGAQSLAQASGEAIADALNVPVGQDLVASVGEIGSATGAAGDQLSLFGDQIEATSTQMTLFDTGAIDAADSMTQIGDGAAAATTGITQVGAATEQAGEAAEQSSEMWGELGKTLLEFAGISVTLDALKELASSAIEAFSTIQNASVALTAMSGSASAAREQIEGLETLANQDALAFPSLLSAAQRMTAFGMSADQVTQSLSLAADASAATGNSFDQVSNSMTRLVESGTAGVRQLVQLGITQQQLASIMGVSATQVTAAFKAMDPSDRLALISTALQKFSGDAQLMADTVTGATNQLSNAWEHTAATIGASIGPIVAGLEQATAYVVSGFGVMWTETIGKIQTQWMDFVTFLQTGSTEGFAEFQASAAQAKAGVDVIVAAFNEGKAAADQFFTSMAGQTAKLQDARDSLANLSVSLDTATTLFQQGKVSADVYQTTVQAYGKALDAASTNGENFANSLLGVSTAQMKSTTLLQESLSTLQQVTPGTADYARAIQNVGAAYDAANPGGVKFADTLMGIQQAASQQQATFSSLSATFAQVSAGFAAGTVSANLFLDVAQKLQTAATATHNVFASAAVDIANVTFAVDQAQASYAAAVTAFQSIENAYENGAASLQDLMKAFDDAKTAATAAGKSFSDAAAAALLLNNNAHLQIQAFTDDIAILSKYKDTVNLTAEQTIAAGTAFQNLSTAGNALGISITKVAGSQNSFNIEAANSSPAVQKMVQDMLSLMTQQGLTATATLKTSSATSGLTSVIGPAGVAVVSFAGSAGQAAADAERLGADISNLTSVYQNLPNSALAAAQAVASFTNAANQQVNSADNVFNAWVSLNSQVQTTIAGQLAVQSAFSKAQGALAQMGIQLTATGATTNSTNTAVQGLVKQLNDAITAMKATPGAAANAANGIKAIGDGATKAKTELDALDQSIDKIDKSLDTMNGNGGSFTTGAAPGSSVSTGAGFDGGSANTTVIPLPSDPNPGQDYYNYATQSWISISSYVNAAGTALQKWTGNVDTSTPAITANTSATTSGTVATIAYTTATAAAGVAMTSLPLQIDPVTGAIINLGNAASGTAANIAYGTSSLSNATSDAADAASQTSTDLANLNTSVGGTINTWNGLVQANQDLVNQFAAGTLSMQQWTADSGAAALQFLNSSSSISTMSTAASGAAQSLSSVTDGMSIYGSQLFQASKDLSDAQARFLSGNQGSQDETIGDAQAVLDSVVAQGHLGGFTGTGTGGPADMTAALKDSGLTQVGQQLYQSQVDLAAALNRASTGNQGTNDLSVSDAQAQVSAVLASMGLGSLTGTGSSASLVGAAALGRTAGDTGINYAAYAPPTYTAGNPLPVTIQNQPPAAITVNLNGVVQNPQQTQQAVQNGIVAGLRQAGLKL